MFHTDPVRPVPASQRAQFQSRSFAADNPAPSPSLAHSAQILARLALDQPRGRLTASQIVIVARNAQGHYPAEVQAAAAQFHAHRHTVRAAFAAQQSGPLSGASLFGGAVRGYRHTDLQALAATFAGQASHVSATVPPQSTVPPAPGWRTQASANGAGAGAGAAGPRRGDAIDDALSQLGRFMQRTRRAFLSVERLLTMERGGSSPARQALDNLSRWGRAAGTVMEDRARLLLTELESRYGDLDVLERQAEQAARQAQQGVFGYPGGLRPPSAETFHRTGGPVITEVDEADDRSKAGTGQTARPQPTRPEPPPRSSGPVITEIFEPAPYRQVAQEPELPARPRPTVSATE